MDDQQGRDYDSHIPELHRILATRFDEGELRTLAFHLQVDYDDLRGEGKSNKARELIAYLVRHGRLPDLLRVGRDFRPDVPWPEAPHAPDEATSAASPDGAVQIEFVNRENELNLLKIERLKASRSPFTLIGAPAGYGKSYLLQSLISTIRSDETIRRQWNYCYVDFGQQLDDPVAHLVQGITGQPAPKDPATAIDLAHDYIVRTLTAPSPRGRRAVLLIFDAVERLDARDREWLFILLHELYRRAHPGPQEIITVRVIVSGRDVEEFWDGYQQVHPQPPAPHRIHLSPFTQHPIQELIWSQAQAIQIPLDDQTVAEMSDELRYLSGGHPQVIRSLVDDLTGQSFAIGPTKDYFSRCRQHLVQTYLSPVADALLQNLDREIRRAVQTLSVFRRVNANTVQALIQARMLPADTDEVKLLGDLQSAHLLDGPSIAEPFFRDNLMRRILALDMAHRSQGSRARYRRLNALALELHRNWIHNLGEALPESHLKSTQQLLSVVEWLFHALQDQDLDRAQLRRGLQAHIRALSPAGQPVPIADLIANEIKRDAEVRYLVQQRLGAGGFNTVCEWLRSS